MVRRVGKGPPCRMKAEPLKEEQGHKLPREGLKIRVMVRIRVRVRVTELLSV